MCLKSRDHAPQSWLVLPIRGRATLHQLSAKADPHTTRLIELTLTHTKFLEIPKTFTTSPCKSSKSIRPTHDTRHNGSPTCDLPPPQRVRRAVPKIPPTGKSFLDFPRSGLTKRGFGDVLGRERLTADCSYNTTSNQTRTIKTPGGKLRLLHIKKRASNPKCGDCGTKLAGVSGPTFRS